VTTLRPVVVVLNAASGARRAEAIERQIRELCGVLGCDARITATPDVPALCRAVEVALVEGADSIVVGGGDGTVSRVAGLLVGRDTALGVLPLGTLNHFARDLGLPLQLDAAVRVALLGRTERFDVGEVNGRSFVNNSSLGLYPLIVRLRAQHPVGGLAKWAVAAWATLREIRRPREIVVRIRVNGEAVLHRTPIVFVANNRYQTGGFEAGTRASLRDGRLAIYIVKAGARRHLLRLAWRMLTRRAQHDELEVLLAESATLEAGGSPLRVAVDGEVEEFESPLEYRIRPAALRIRVTPASDPSTAEPPQAQKYTPTATRLRP
jgi:diacylglycerol kinase family enzyme